MGRLKGLLPKSGQLHGDGFFGRRPGRTAPFRSVLSDGGSCSRATPSGQQPLKGEAPPSFHGDDLTRSAFSGFEMGSLSGQTGQPLDPCDRSLH